MLIYTSVVCTLISGLLRFKLPIHHRLAYLTVTSASLHFLLVMIVKLTRAGH